jgi:hypothetical protein
LISVVDETWHGFPFDATHLLEQAWAILCQALLLRMGPDAVSISLEFEIALTIAIYFLSDMEMQFISS